MQKPTLLAVLLGLLMIAAAVVYHGRQVAQLSKRLEAMEQRTSGLDERLEKLSTELPDVVEQAGNNAGRQVVRGIMQELTDIPSHWLGSKKAFSPSNSVSKASAPRAEGADPGETGSALVRFDVRDFTIKIEVLPNPRDSNVLSPVSSSPGQDK